MENINCLDACATALTGAVDVRRRCRALTVARRAARRRELHDGARVRDQALAGELLGLAPGVGELPEVDDRAVGVADGPGDVAARGLDLTRDREAVVDADAPHLGPRRDRARRRPVDAANLARARTRE